MAFDEADCIRLAVQMCTSATSQSDWMSARRRLQYMFQLASTNTYLSPSPSPPPDRPHSFLLHCSVSTLIVMEVALTFGSLGDIIQLCQLAVQLSRAVGIGCHANGNSAVEYQELRNDLDTLVRILMQVSRVPLRSCLLPLAYLNSFIGSRNLRTTRVFTISERPRFSHERSCQSMRWTN